MTLALPTLADFEAALDEDPSNHVLRLVYSDLLEEVGTPEARLYAAGLRWEAENEKDPYYCKPDNDWSWFHTHESVSKRREELPEGVFKQLKGYKEAAGGRALYYKEYLARTAADLPYREYLTRTLAEQALALALLTTGEITVPGAKVKVTE